MVKAIKITETGNANVMKFVDVELKKLAPNEVLIRNKAIGLNYIDVYHRAGTYPLPLPTGIGLEAAGVIEEVGSDVKEFKVGDRVAHAAAPPGSYSEILFSSCTGPENIYYNQDNEIIFDVNSILKENLSIQIYDVQGRILLQSVFQTNEGMNHFELNVDNLLTGAYTVVLSGNETIITKKIIIAK